MSVEAMAWALLEAPDVPAQLVAVLIGMANHAGPDGRNAYPSHTTLAKYARKTPRQIRRDVADLLERGIIRRGDQRIVEHLPPDRRPVNYDLAMDLRRSDQDGGTPTTARTPESARTPTTARTPESARTPTTARTSVSHRGDTRDRPDAHDRADAHDRTGGHPRPDGGTPMTAREDTHVLQPVLEPSLNQTPPTPPAPEPPPAAVDNEGGGMDRKELLHRALIDEVRAVRPEWSSAAVQRAISHAEVAARPWHMISAAALAIARDPATVGPGRLAAPGPWWQTGVPRPPSDPASRTVAEALKLANPRPAT